MKYSTARAMQVSYLERGQLDDLHLKEVSLGRCLMPHEIQNLLKVTPIRERYEMPEDEENLAVHSRRIEARLKESSDGLFLDALSVENVHRFDEKVYSGKENMVWDYSSSGGRKRNIISQLCFFL